ncbi:hypothetical protein M3J09_013269 [Ascochyta lentis]
MARDLTAVPGRSRSFGGCATCRSRHIKCDEARPACQTCEHAGIQCGGYEKSIFFDFEAASNADIARFRRPLFTEEEREKMSQWLTNAVSPRTIMRQFRRCFPAMLVLSNIMI